MSAGEEAILIRCGQARLVGILHRCAPARTGVLLVVGGPQYRVGSHRQFVLLARRLAREGIPVLRFDYRGMGDSDPPDVGFEQCLPDIEAAIDAFTDRVPDIERVVIWGLCDAASAALLYANRDPRVAGLVLLNPWVRREQSEARTYLRHYYLRRVLDADFWRRVFTGGIAFRQSARDLFRSLRASLRSTSAEASEAAASAGDADFVTGMCQGLAAFSGPCLFILSGDDLTAAEFRDEVRRSAQWARAMGRESIEIREIAESNHTFARREWRDRVGDWTAEWVASL